MPIDIGGTNGILPVHPRDFVVYTKATLAIVVNDVGITRFWYCRSGFATPNIHHDLRSLWRCTTGSAAGYGNGRIILLCPVNPIGILVIYGHLVNFCCGLIELGGPGLSSIVGNIRSPIVGLDQ